MYFFDSSSISDSVGIVSILAQIEETDKESITTNKDRTTITVNINKNNVFDIENKNNNNNLSR